MNTLENDYLVKNNFHKEDDRSIVSNVISRRSFLEDDGFNDERQCNIIRAQFGDELKNVEDMRLTVKPVGDVEFDVVLSWHTSDGESHESAIGGEGLYELVSQAIVLANIGKF